MAYAKKNQCGNTGQSKNVQLTGENISEFNTPITLHQSELNFVLGGLSPNANQERRFIETLAKNPLIHTKRACQKIACVNLSDLRQRTQKLLARHHLEARCTSPSTPIKNGFNENSGQKLWGLYRTSNPYEATNQELINDMEIAAERYEKLGRMDSAENCYQRIAELQGAK